MPSPFPNQPTKQRTRNQSRAAARQPSTLLFPHRGKPETRNFLLPTALLLAALISLTSCITAGHAVVTQRVYGTVVDARTQKPIAHARVALEDDPTIATTTSVDGAFNIPPQRVLQVRVLAQSSHRTSPPPILIIAPGYRAIIVTSFNHRHEIALTRE